MAAGVELDIGVNREVWPQPLSALARKTIPGRRRLLHVESPADLHWVFLNLFLVLVVIAFCTLSIRAGQEGLEISR
jgi:hypothetical protein